MLFVSGDREGGHGILSDISYKGNVQCQRVWLLTSFSLRLGIRRVRLRAFWYQDLELCMPHAHL